MDVTEGMIMFALILNIQKKRRVKETSKALTIVPTEEKTDTRVHGTVCVSNNLGN